jgi:hypothetical protein
VNKTQITDAGLAAIGRLTSLKELQLAETAITDRGLAELSKLGRLRLLVLRETNITRSGLAALFALTELRELSISENDQLTDADIQELKRHLPNCKIRFCFREPRGGKWSADY